MYFKQSIKCCWSFAIVHSDNSPKKHTSLLKSFQTQNKKLLEHFYVYVAPKCNFNFQCFFVQFVCYALVALESPLVALEWLLSHRSITIPFHLGFLDVWYVNTAIYASSTVVPNLWPEWYHLCGEAAVGTLNALNRHPSDGSDVRSPWKPYARWCL